MILSGSSDKILRLWDTQSGKLLRTLEGHKGWVRCCVFSPDGKMILSGSYDGTLRLWDAQSGKLLHVSFIADDNEWASILPEKKEILRRSEGAWRHIQWNQYMPNGKVKIYRAEYFD
jgi:WD40 repeat protein